MLNALWNNAWLVEMVNHLWQSTLVVLMAWMLSLMLKRYQARIRYWVWMAASLKFLLPLSLLAAMGERLHSAGILAITRTSLTGAVCRVEHPFRPPLKVQGRSACGFLKRLPLRRLSIPGLLHLKCSWRCGYAERCSCCLAGSGLGGRFGS